MVALVRYLNEAKIHPCQEDLLFGKLVDGGVKM